jgi:hypothetical protein
MSTDVEIAPTLIVGKDKEDVGFLPLDRGGWFFLRVQIRHARQEARQQAGEQAGEQAAGHQPCSRPANRLTLVCHDDSP